jgi:hypothetical protein
MKDQIEVTTVQQEWMGITNDSDKNASSIVVRECSCLFD